jgi:ABC-type Fe3+-hydroxamate transport system substrate-binding protein
MERPFGYPAASAFSFRYSFSIFAKSESAFDSQEPNIPDVKKRAASAGNVSSGNVSAQNASAGNSIVDCGSSMAPDIERIIALKPEAILLSPFENSGGYGKLDKRQSPPAVAIPTEYSGRFRQSESPK